jgi:hypothetical protein
MCMCEARVMVDATARLRVLWLRDPVGVCWLLLPRPPQNVQGYDVCLCRASFTRITKLIATDCETWNNSVISTDMILS